MPKVMNNAERFGKLKEDGTLFTTFILLNFYL